MHENKLAVDAAIKATALVNGRKSLHSSEQWRRKVPTDDAALIRELYERVVRAPGARQVSLRQPVMVLARQLVVRGYTYSAIARAVGVHHAGTVARWCDQATTADVAGVVEDIPHREAIDGASKTERHPVPPQDADTLIELQLLVMDNAFDVEARTKLDLLCGQLHRRGYTLAAIAQVLDVTREMVRLRVSRVPEELLRGVETEIVERPAGRAAIRRETTQRLTETEVGRYLEVAPLAKLYRRGTAPDSAVGEAHREAMQILLAGYERGVSNPTLVRQLNVTRAAIRNRVHRALGTLPPSMRPKGFSADPPPAERRPLRPAESSDASGTDESNHQIWPERAGRLTDFVPETASMPPVKVPAAGVTSPEAQHRSHVNHAFLEREVRAAARSGGHTTLVWDVGQDASFVRGNVLVNVEVKSIGGSADQYRLGVGQLSEQIQHHLDHLTAGSPWYLSNGITAVVGVLVVTDQVVSPAWQRLASRLNMAIWPAEFALDVFSDPNLSGLPPGCARPLSTSSQL